MKKVMNEHITITESKALDDILIGYEMSYEDGTKVFMLNLLWSSLIFLIALLV